MSVAYTSQDGDRLSAALRALLSPFEYDRVESWRREASQKLKALLQADAATFGTPTPAGAVDWQSDELNVKPYSEMLAALDEPFGVAKRLRELGVWSRRSAYHPFDREVRRTAYYNEYVVPNRAFDSLGITIDVKRGSSTAGLIFHHQRASGRRFGTRGLTLLNIVLPAFKAGVRTYVKLAGARHEFSRLLDCLPEAIAVYAPPGRLLHANQPLLRLLADDPDRAQLEHAIARSARTAAATSMTEMATRPYTYETATAAARYRLSSIFGGGLVDVEGAVAVVVEPCAPRTPSLAGLAESFGLTERQAQVAWLLALGRSNQGIAQALGISEHTARHHVEMVLAKLGVNTRGAVGSKILTDAPLPPSLGAPARPSPKR